MKRRRKREMNRIRKCMSWISVFDLILGGITRREENRRSGRVRSGKGRGRGRRRRMARRSSVDVPAPTTITTTMKMGSTNQQPSLPDPFLLPTQSQSLLPSSTP